MSVKLGDLFFCTEQGGHIFAETKEGRLLHISDVPSGLACNCVCPGCGRRMVARKGRIAHHFAHHRDVKATICASAGETALHKFAKQTLNERLTIFLPKKIIESDQDKEIVVKEGRYAFDKAILEKREGKIVPDVVLFMKDRQLIVEFKVTHACDEGKIDRIKKTNIAAIEIDLSQYRDMPLSELSDLILFNAPRVWLHNPRERDGWHRLEKRRRQRFAQARVEANRLQSAYAHLTLPPNSETGYFEESAQREGLEDAIGKKVNGSVCFRVHFREWQSYILMEWVLQFPRGFEVDEVIYSLRQQGWIRPDFENLTSEIVAAAKLGGRPFYTPADAVKAYFEIATDGGILRRNGNGKWLATQGLREIIGAAREARTVRANRLAEVRKVIGKLLEDVPETDLVEFNIDTWIRTPLPERSYCPADTISFEYQTWMSFVTELKNVGSSLLYSERMPSDLLGLPLGPTFERELEARREAEKQRALAREAQRQAESERRVAKIKQLAGKELEGEAEDWLVGSNPNLGGLSPVEAAARAGDGFREASSIIDRLVWDKQQKALARANKMAALELLRKEAEKRLPTKEHASLWMRAKLGGIESRSPQDHCVDMATMRECISYLPAKRSRK